MAGQPWAGPEVIAAGMIFQTMYYLVDLYFVSRLGGTAIAGVSAAGNVQFMFNALPSMLQHIQAGRLRPLASTGLTRSPQLPEVPTVAESGYPGYDVSVWGTMIVPKGTPPAIVAIRGE